MKFCWIPFKIAQEDREKHHKAIYNLKLTCSYIKVERKLHSKSRFDRLNGVHFNFNDCRILLISIGYPSDICWISNGLSTKYPLLPKNTQLVSGIIIQHIKVVSMAPFAYISDIFSSDICESHSESSESTVITALLSYSSLIMSQSQASGSQYEASHYANSFIDPELL